jgi:hypothetical protein
MTNLLTNYNISTSNIDLSQVFPLYQILTNELRNPSSGSGVEYFYNFTLTSGFSTTNYFVIPTFYVNIGGSGTGNSYQLSNESFFPIIFNRSSTGFSIYLRFTVNQTITNYSSGCKLVCLVIFYNTNAPNTAIQSTTNFNAPSSSVFSIRIQNYFPQYSYNVWTGNPASSSSGYNFSATSDFSNKSNTTTNYFTTAAYELTDGSVEEFATVANSVMSLNVSSSRTTTQCQFRSYIDRTASVSCTFSFNALILFLPASFQGDYYYYDPSFNSMFPPNTDTFRFKSIFPRFTILSFSFSNSSREIYIGDFVFPQNVGTTSYEVFPSFYYNTDGGSSSTYSIYEASIVSNNLIVSNKTTDGFVISFIKGTGDIWNGTIVALVIFP